MIDRNVIAKDLTEAFVKYVWRLDNPFPTPDENMDLMLDKYRHDAMFHSKVTSLVCGVMLILNKHLDEG